MKIIFLDHDGVICLPDNWGSRFKKRKKFKDLSSPLPVDLRFDNFDKKAVKTLNSILEKTGAEIVVSSDWKLHANLDEIGDYYLTKGILKKPIALTQQMSDFDPTGASLFHWKGWLERARAVEINHFVANTPGIEKWVAVDDLPLGKDYLGEGGLENFVICKRRLEGIKQLGIDQLIISHLQS